MAVSKPNFLSLFVFFCTLVLVYSNDNVNTDSGSGNVNGMGQSLPYRQDCSGLGCPCYSNCAGSSNCCGDYNNPNCGSNGYNNCPQNPGVGSGCCVSSGCPSCNTPPPPQCQWQPPPYNCGCNNQNTAPVRQVDPAINEKSTPAAAMAPAHSPLN